MGKAGHNKKGSLKRKFLAVFTAIFACSALLSTLVAPNAFADENEECFGQGGSVSWIACPVTEYVARGQDGIYSFLNDWLSIDSGFFSTGSDSGTYIAWAIFRNIANIILVIILLIIIFSQVTGVGIDNYGIKRALPRLIAIALLVNLSFVICQLAVDVSNVLGSSVSKLLVGTAEGIQANLSGNAAEYAAASALDIVLVILGGAASATAVALPAVAGLVGSVGAASFWILLIPLIIMLVIALVAVLMFFLMLAARQMIAIICVAISPIAMACYVLPNTQNLGKKWFDALKACLVIHPICSALYGVGQLVKVITASASGVHIFMLMIAQIACFLPYFVAPSLIKRSLNAIGNAGAMFDRLSHGLKGAGRQASNAWQRSDKYQHAQSQAKVGFNKARLNGRRLSDSKRNRLQNRVNQISQRGIEAEARGEQLSERQARRLMRAQNRLDSDGQRGLVGKQQRLKDATDATRLAELDQIAANGGVLTSEQLREQKRLRRAQNKLDSTNNTMGRLRMENISESKNQQKVGAYADANKERAAMSNLESQLEEERISDQMSLLQSGGYTYDNGKTVNVDSLDSLQEALEYESGEGGNIENAMALMRTLESKGDNGMDRVSKVLDSGKATNKSVRQRMARSVANSGKYKTGTRSTHIAAQRMLDNPDSYSAGMVSEVRNSGDALGKYKTDNVPDMTDSEFNSLVDDYAGTPKAAQAAGIMNAALSDDRVRNRLKSGQIARMERAIQAAGLSPATQNGIPVGPAASGAPLHVDNSGAAGPTPAPTVVQSGSPAPAPGSTTVHVNQDSAPAQDQVINANVHTQGSSSPQVSNIDVQREAEVSALHNPTLSGEEVRNILAQGPGVAPSGSPTHINDVAGTNTASSTINRTTNTHTDTTSNETVNQNVNRHETTTTNRQVEQNVNNQHNETVTQNVNTRTDSQNTVAATSEAAAADATRTAVNNSTQSTRRRDQMSSSEASARLDNLARQRNNRNNNGPGGIIFPN